ncbi:MAG: class I SAM-dependent methyltransferase [Bacteriovoracaceae bacterium]
MKKIINTSVFFSNLSKTLVYSLEYRLLYQLSNSLSWFVKAPLKEKNQEIVKHLRQKILSLHQQDAQNISDGYYPLEVIKPKSPKDHLMNLPYLLLDSLKVSRRRKLNLKKDFKVEPQDVPDYLKRNYHFQTDGYFSEKSAMIYEHQVEVLFSGTAAPMRRMLIKLIKEKIKTGKPLRILELGAGVGSASIDFAHSFQFESYTLLDISKPYLDVAQARLTGKNLHFVQAPAEKIPSLDNQFDLVFSVFLFHELPRSVREKVLIESYRVLAPQGIMGICDSIQIDDDPKINGVLENFPVDYHEPFYKDYTLWNAKEALSLVGFRDIASDVNFLSKYWVAEK